MIGKFKVWDVKKKCWFKKTYEEFIITSDGELKLFKWDGYRHYATSVSSDEYEKFFCSDIPDSNGKEIYEGDIVIIDDIIKRIFEVIYKKGYFGIIDIDDNFISFCDINNKDIEIIGHIKTNPKLIEKIIDEK